MDTHELPIDIEKYLHKLDFYSVPEPTLPNLALLQERHITHFPFQTLSTVMKQPVSLVLDDLYKKVITTQQGGYCYELNLLFGALLMKLGYGVTVLSGHVIQDTNFVRRGPRTHILLKVTIDDEVYISDVGHGGLTPTAPLRLFTTELQETPHGNYVVVHPDEFYYLRAAVNSDWRTLYGFDLQPQHQSDLEVGNWWVSTHPSSFFRTILMVSRVEPGGIRHALLNNRYSIHEIGKPSSTTFLGSAKEVIEIIEGPFKLYIPQRQEALHRIEKLLATPPPSFKPL